MTTFDPKTAYRNDWQSHDFVETADYQAPGSDATAVSGIKVKQGDPSDSDYQRAATGLELTTNSAVFVAWNPTDELFNPLPDGLILIDDPDEETTQGWLVRNVVRSRFGHWTIGCQARRVDTDA